MEGENGHEMSVSSVIFSLVLALEIHYKGSAVSVRSPVVHQERMKLVSNFSVLVVNALNSL